ncbi:insulinase family protein [Tumebacillus sp. ITR2]|uniref:Insulinase family protein n=1 Tax=Tumebacillus amylolyticus TaxID=2801339 RepID=A0ABS1J8S5_9BACL|nr:pitrilysin family protein [Tumebacillus amylolyticus]MBL0386464.1 insulinase family protein [Tumebacillus amylolyticus]
MIRKTTLPNGLRIVTEKTPYLRGAVAHLRYGVGSGLEPFRLWGVAHVLEHMVFKGTPVMDQVVFGNEIARLGCSTNASTGFESTTFEIDGPAETILQGLDLFAALLTGFHVPPEEFDKEKDVIQEEWKMYRDDPSAWGEDIAYHSLLGNFAHPTIGTPESIDSLTRRQVLEFSQAHYTPDNLVVGVVGNLEHEDVVEVLLKYFGDNDRKCQPLRLPPLSQIKSRHEEEDSEQEQVFVGYRAPSIQRPDLPAFDAAMTIFGGDSWSRLFQRLRNELGLVYNVDGGYSGWPHVGIYMIYAGCQPSETDRVLAEIANEIEKFKADISGDELLRSKAMLRASLLMSSDQLGNKVQKLIDDEVLWGEWRPYERDIADLEAVTLDEAMRLVHEVFNDKQMTRVTVGPHQPK